jgi:serine/threonine protein kinase
MPIAPSDTVTGLRGTYRIEAKHGEGSFGITYRATDAATGDALIVKELRIEKLHDWKALELFEREGEVLSSLSHPNIPAFRDFFAHGGPSALPVSVLSADNAPEHLSLVLVQEFIEGVTLEQRIRLGQRMEPRDGERVLRELLGALHYLHERTPPLVHRDIKPGNVIVTPDGHAYLVDFGAIQNRLRSPDETGSTIVGTVGYMPLEQLRGDARPASDLYALGVTMVVALAGRPLAELPFDDSSGRIATKAALPHDTPESLRHAIDSMIAPLLGQRAKSAHEVAAKIEAPRPAAGRPPAEVPRESPRAEAPRESPERWEEQRHKAALARRLAEDERRRAREEEPKREPEAKRVDPSEGDAGAEDSISGGGWWRRSPSLRAAAIGLPLVGLTAALVSYLSKDIGSKRDLSASLTATAKGDAGRAPAPSASASSPQPDIETGPVTVTWTGHIDSSTGSAPPVHSPCTLTVTTELIGKDREQKRTTFESKGEVLYDSKQLGGTYNRSFYLDEQLTGEDVVATYRYYLRMSDVGARIPPGAQISVTTPKTEADVWRDTSSPFRIHAVLDKQSSMREGKPLRRDTQPLFDGVALRVARVKSKTGIVPFTTQTCALRLAPARSGQLNCRVRLECGKDVVYGAGSGGYNQCTIATREVTGFVDPNPTPKDGDPELAVDLAAGTATLGDTSKTGAKYTVSFTLDGSAADAGPQAPE